MGLHSKRLVKKARLLRDRANLNSTLWYVGRTDLQSLTIDFQPEHYAYNDAAGVRIRFLANTGDKALKKAIKFCELSLDAESL